MIIDSINQWMFVSDYMDALCNHCYGTCNLNLTKNKKKKNNGKNGNVWSWGWTYNIANNRSLWSSFSVFTSIPQSFFSLKFRIPQQPIVSPSQPIHLYLPLQLCLAVSCTAHSLTSENKDKEREKNHWIENRRVAHTRTAHYNK